MPVKPLATLLRVVREQGYPIERALEQIGLEFNPLDPAQVAPAEVPTSSYSRLYGLLMELLQDEAFGLGEAYRAPPGTFRMMCLFIIHCTSLEQALRRSWEFFDYCDQYRALDPGNAGLPLRELDDPEQLLCVFQRGAGQWETQVAQANILLMMYRFYSWLVGKALPLAGLHLRGPDSGNRSDYEQLFNCPVYFDAGISGFALPRTALKLPVVQTEESLRDFLRQTPYMLVRRDPPGQERSLSDQVERILTRYSSGPLPGAQEVAGELNMSPRTLHRRLTREGCSFQQLKDDFRCQIALHYLGRRELSIDAVAALLGFQDNSAFYRSFRKWTGTSPGQYRDQLNDE